uniref:Putative rep protein n=1 Tax=uncultured virus TaxID=340016 RepID=A0A1D8MJZ8_9VIRU|nr:putative rep protein [uncultured virus]
MTSTVVNTRGGTGFFLYTMPKHPTCSVCNHLIQCTDKECYDCVETAEPFCECLLESELSRMTIPVPTRPLHRIQMEAKIFQENQFRNESSASVPEALSSPTLVVHYCLNNIEAVRRLTGSWSNSASRSRSDMLRAKLTSTSISDSRANWISLIADISTPLSKLTETLRWIDTIPTSEMSEERDLLCGFGNICARTAEYSLQILLEQRNSTPAQRTFAKSMVTASHGLTTMLQQTSHAQNTLCPFQTAKSLRDQLQPTRSATFGSGDHQTQARHSGLNALCTATGITRLPTPSIPLTTTPMKNWLCGTTCNPKRRFSSISATTQPTHDPCPEKRATIEEISQEEQ